MKEKEGRWWEGRRGCGGQLRDGEVKERKEVSVVFMQ